MDRTPIQMTPNRKLALIMGRFTAEAAIKAITTWQCTPELVPVMVTTRLSQVAVRATA